MPGRDLDAEIRERIDTFLEDISLLVKEAALEAVRDALGEQAGTTPRRAAKRATKRRTKKRTTKKRTTKKRTTKKRTTKKRTTKKRVGKKRGARRGPGRPRRQSDAQIERISARIMKHVGNHPGSRLEELSKSLRIPSKDLKRPVADLLEGKKLRKTGARRGTKYFAT